MLLFKPLPASREVFDSYTLANDLEGLAKFGSAGAGEKAVYLGTYFLDRRYYIPYSAISRIYKRIAMTKGGFTGKGMFASVAYLVVELKEGGERKCALKREEHVDMLLSYVKKRAPELKFYSLEGERRLERIRKEEEKRYKKNLPPTVLSLLKELQNQSDYLEREPEKYTRLSLASKKKRANDTSKASLKFLALAIVLLGLVSALYGVGSLVGGSGNYSIYFVLFGFAAIFLFSGLSVLPTGQNNRKAIIRNLENARGEMEEYIKGYEGFLLPSKYAHPATFSRIARVLKEGRAEDFASAFATMKEDLKAINSNTQVYQEEYDEIVAVKPMFLLEDYK